MEQDKKENKEKKDKYVRLLLILLATLTAILMLLTFSDHKHLPNWNKILNALFSSEPAPTETDFVRFIDVGQGDSILISSNGYNALLDFGNATTYGSELYDTLEGYGIKELDCVFISHYDSDHVGGAAKIVDGFPVYYAVVPELNDRGKQQYSDLQYSFEANGTEIQVARLGMAVNIGDFEITVIGYYPGETEDNDRSLVLMAKIHGKKFLFTGDAGFAVEKHLMADGINLDCDVLKAAHHGSRNSTSEEFVKAASPEYAVISAGVSNQYGHPHEEVIEILEAAGAKLYRTDRQGDITFDVTDGSIKAETQF